MAGVVRSVRANRGLRLRCSNLQKPPMQVHEQKNGSLGCIYKDVIFSTTNAMKPTNERLAGLETTLPCSLLATVHPHDTTSAVLSSGPDRHQ